MIEENLDPDWIGEVTEEEEIYRENVLDHFKNPRNFGKLDLNTFSHKEFNPVCGDQIEIFVHLSNGNVTDVKFTAKGCAISVAGASILTEKIKGMSIEDLRNLKKEEVLEMIGIPLGIVRMKCGLLCLKTLMNGLKIFEGKNE
mgnify:CR=1 FL=1